VCVCEREIETERKREREKGRVYVSEVDAAWPVLSSVADSKHRFLCVREKKREGERERPEERESGVCVFDELWSVLSSLLT